MPAIIRAIFNIILFNFPAVNRQGPVSLFLKRNYSRPITAKSGVQLDLSGSDPPTSLYGLLL